MRRRAWFVYLLVGVALTPVYFFALRGHFWPQQYMYFAFGLGSAVGIAAGIRLNRPEHPLAWWLFAFGMVLFVAGDLGFDLLGANGAVPPIPSIADWFYLSSYPLLAAGLLLLVHHRFPGRHVISALDGVMVAIGVGVVAWVFIMEPDFHQPGLSLLHRLVVTAYPVWDLLLLAIIARFLLRKADRSPAFVLLACSILLLLVSDLVFDFGVLKGWYRGGDPVDFGYIASYALWGAAALHPSMGSLSTPASQQHRSSRASIVTLTIAALAPPTMLVVQDLRHVRADGPLLAVASALMFLLALARIGSMTRTLNRSTTLLERSVARKLALSRSAVELIASEGEEGLFEIATRSAVALTESDTVGAFFCLWGDSAPLGVAASGIKSYPPTAEELGVCWEEVSEGVASYVGNSAGDYGPAHSGAQPPVLQKVGRWYAGPVVVEGRLRGVLLVVGLDDTDDDLLVALDLLCTEIELSMRIADGTEQRHRAQTERFFQSVVKNSSDVVTFLDVDGYIRNQGASVQQIVGLGPEEIVGRSLHEFLHADDVEMARSRFVNILQGGHGASERLECRVQRVDGSWCHVDTVMTNLLEDPDVLAVVLNTRDISDRVALERELQHQSLSDSLTGLPNRALLLDRTDHALVRAAAKDRTLALLYLDLDDFKMVNEGLGHAAGDRLLVLVAQRLEASTLPGDTVAHLGGDEFVVLLEDGHMPKAAALVAQRMIDAIREPISIDGNDVPLRASVGIAFAEPGQHTSDAILRNADLAMYMAKNSGKGRFEYFQTDMHEQAVKRFHVAADLRRALKVGELEVFFQPIVESATKVIIGAEALVRWRHPERGLIPPIEFIPVAESTGLIVPLDNFVLAESCRQVKQWRDENLVDEHFYVSVNVSAVELLDDAIIGNVTSVLESSGLDPSQLALEVTETMLVDNYENAVLLLGSLKALGLRLALDDFGTGYSSLSYLSNFPVDIIKIDKSFIDRIADSDQGAQMVRVVVDLAKALRLTAVAEGIEYEEQLEVLNSLACHAFQGYLFAKPMPAAEMTGMLASLVSGDISVSA